MEKVIKKTNDWANFILRRIEDGVETDTMLGGFYSYIEKEKSIEAFNAHIKDWDEDELKDCYAVITFFEDSYMPLYEGSNYYIMTDTGGTIANRSKK
ncbi:MAG: hypothetical protein M0R17_04480 [Candidatus Omnitrophica bacterium]|jgi:hypothetical protein|nr:hypothetical protein [Candidatus Omnitrophota bacterium]